MFHSHAESSSSVVPHSDDSDADCSTSSATAVNLLDRLRSPTPADLSRKRKVPANPPKGLKKCSGTVASEPTTVAASSRVKEIT